MSCYNGSNDSLLILVVIWGKIYDVSSGKFFYGLGGFYVMFFGKDVSCVFVKMFIKEEDVVVDFDGFIDKEIGVLDDWDCKFVVKYFVVGCVCFSF